MQDRTFIEHIVVKNPDLSTALSRDQLQSTTNHNSFKNIERFKKDNKNFQQKKFTKKKRFVLYLKSMAGFTSHELQSTLQNRTRISKRLFPFPFPSFFFLIYHHYVQNFSHLRRHFSSLFSLSATKTQIF